MQYELFPKKIRELMRKEISAANENEVFFCAKIEEESISSIKVIARGNKNSVPAVVKPIPGEKILVLHNHPSGDLTPSGADITVASRLARDGIGFAIVDNLVSRCYVVVEPVELKKRQTVTTTQVEDILAPGGTVARLMDNFETRSQQVDMANNLVVALNKGEHALAEAGTGTGKSLAYLVPAILWAKANNKRVVVSTNTINLQEQLLYKDIPLLQKAISGFKAVLVKGRSNYLCRRKFRELLQQGQALVEEGDLGTLQALALWEPKTKDGSKSDLGLNPGADLWELVASDGDVCLRVNCQHFRECFFHNARREALDAQVLIVNHSLLFADIAMRSKGADTGVLPEYSCIIFDEAHNIENVATDWLGARVTRLAFSRLLARLWAARKNGRPKGLLPVLEQKLSAANLDQSLTQALADTIHKLVPDIIRTGEVVGEFFATLETLLSQGSKDTKFRLTDEFTRQRGWKGCLDKGKYLREIIAELERSLDSLYNRLENIGPQGFDIVLAQAMELNSIRSRLKGLDADIQEVLFGTDPALVRWLELSQTRGGPRAVLYYAPLTVRSTLREHVWEKYSSVILTSATLTVNGDFAYIRERLGLDSDLKIREMQYDSPFDYRNCVLLGVAADMPSPEEPGFRSHLAPAILASLRATQGRALILFTSYSLLRMTAAELSPKLEELGIPMLIQGQMPRHSLLENFKVDTKAVLLATTSFWEGVDVAGESLSSVILTRLPFTVPDEPIVQARIDDLKSKGENPFYAYQVPQAVLRFKQGFGRLIRTKRDRGVVLVLDRRIISKSYGRQFINSLPPCPLEKDRLDKLLSSHKRFLAIK